MAKIQGYKRIIVEDFEEKDRTLVDKLASNINTTMEEITDALSKKLSVNDNLTLNQRSFLVTVDGSGVPTPDVNVQSGLSSSCFGVSVVRAQNITNPSNTPTSHPFITFTDNTGLLKINKISGLQSSEQYRITIILWPS